jgi:tetratricopeptide (TPR) repeat protein
MWKRALLLLPLFVVALASARDNPQTWLEVRTQHFTIVTNSNEKTGRRIADQFERMRAVFHIAFPHLTIDTGSPIIVLAVKDDKEFRALEPQSYLAKGQLTLDGLFLRAPDKNYVLMRVDAAGDHPYAVIYHEYTHLILGKAAEWMPLWLNEGMAEFYQTTDIHEKEVELGQASPENILLLRDSKLLPLATLFTVDTNSPYYHEENKGSIFYAESWALTHYLVINDSQQKLHRLNDYQDLLMKNVDPVTAATRAFGDLNQLQSNLQHYIGQGSFRYNRLPTAIQVDDTAFKVQPLTAVQTDAVRADFLAYNDRVADAKPLLDQVLKEDPQNVSAHETMGFLEFRAGHLDEARKWYEQAVKLDSQSYVAHYYFAAISMSLGAQPAAATNAATPPGNDPQVESSLRAAIKLNPSFAPAYERLAALEGSHQQNLDEAHLMALTAVQLDPGNINYRMTTANVLMEMNRGKDAIAVVHEALRLAKSPQETETAQSFLTQLENYAAARELQAEQNRVMTEVAKADAQANAAYAAQDAANAAVPEETPPKGPHRFLVGTLQNVQCHASRIDLTLVAKAKTMALHSGNYYKIVFSVLNFTPKGDLSPCTDLEGKPAKVEYMESPAESPATPAPAYVVAIEIHH